MGNNGIVGVPEGWEIIRIGWPKLDDKWLDFTEDHRIGVVTQINPEYEYDVPVAIVQRKAHWTKLWPMQWRETPLQGRLRNHIDSPWEYETIVQYRPGQMKWKTADNRWWQYAEVRSMDVPQ